MTLTPNRTAFLIVATLGVFGLATLGQEPAKKTPPRGRLPAHYKDLVSPDQREEIYAVQLKFNSKIDALEAQIEELKKERDAQVERVLTPQQLARLRLLQDAKGKIAEEGAPAKVPAAAAKANNSKKDVFPK